MKRKLLLLVASFLGLTTVSYSQNMKYEYDDAGNRKARLQVSALSFVEQNHQEEAPSIEELLSQNNVNVYPNQVEAELTIALTELPSPGNGKAVFYNLQGSQVLQRMQQTYSYAKNAVASVAYSSSKDQNICKEKMTYSRGYLMEVKLDNTSVWKLTEENALGQPTKAVTGPLPRTYAYTAYGMPTERKAGTMQHFTYSFDVSKGNLSSRIDKLRNLTESFGYDNLNCLTTYGGKTTAYDVKGNITSMSGIGTMSYTQSNKPYALTGVALTGNQIPTRTQNVTYTSF